jgi:ankyrin repeat protein
MNPAWENAIKRGDIHTVRSLVGRRMDVNARDRYGQTALMLAAHAGHCEIVETLIAQRADLNVTAKFGLSALMLAIISGHENIARLLATSGADLLLQATGTSGFTGKTAYDLAMELGMLELSTKLKPKT